MNIDILKNIVLLTLIIFLFLVISNDKNYNNYIKRNKINYLVLLLLIYFIYIEMPLSIIIVFLLVVLILNKNFYYKYLKQNKYIKDYIPNIESFDNNSNKDSEPNNDLENFEYKPHIVDEESKKSDEESNKSEEELNSEKKYIQEPFKQKVQTIKEHLNKAINNIN